MENIRKNMSHRWLQYLFVIVVIWFAVAFLLYPTFSILKDTFVSDGSFSLETVSRVFDSNRAMTAIKNSILLAITLTVTVNIVGIFIVFATEYFDIKGASILRIIFMSTLVFSGLILNNGYLYVYGQDGIFTQLLLKINPDLNPMWFSGYPAVLFVMTFACTSSHMLFLRNAVVGMDYGMIEAAKNLGSSQFQILRKVVLPTLKPVLLTLIIMTFQTGLGAMAAPLMVGGRDFQTISPLILTFAQRPGSRDIAAFLSLLLGMAQIVLLVVITYNEKRGHYMSISKTKTTIKKQKIENPVVNAVVHAISYILAFIYAAPVILVILFSFMNTEGIATNTLSFANFTLENYISILTNPANYQPFVTSVIFSAIAAIGAVVFMLLLARWIIKNNNNQFVQGIEFIYYIPWLLPALFIALGLIIGYAVPHPLIFGNSVIGSLWPLPVAYMIMMLPSTLRYIKSAYYSFDNNLEDASQILGASSMRTFVKVVIPSLLPTALALIALNFNGKLADYDLSAFLYHPNYPTLGIVIRSAADPSANINAKAINLVYSVLLMIISSIIMYVVYGRGTQMSERRGGIQ